MNTSAFFAFQWQVAMSTFFAAFGTIFFEISTFTDLRPVTVLAIRLVLSMEAYLRTPTLFAPVFQSAVPAYARALAGYALYFPFSTFTYLARLNPFFLRWSLFRNRWSFFRWSFFRGRPNVHQKLCSFRNSRDGTHLASVLDKPMWTAITLRATFFFPAMRTKNVRTAYFAVTLELLMITKLYLFGGAT